MSEERPSNGFATMALSTKFMYDYLECQGIKPLPIEIELLKIIDREFLRAINGHSESSNKG